MNPQATSRLVLKGGLGYLRKHISNQTSNPYWFPPNEDELMDIKQSVLDIHMERRGRNDDKSGDFWAESRILINGITAFNLTEAQAQTSEMKYSQADILLSIQTLLLQTDICQNRSFKSQQRRLVNNNPRDNHESLNNICIMLHTKHY